MTIWDALNLIGGLSLFLFGMNIMGQALERRAGSNLRSVLEKITSNKWMGLLTGLAVTAVIQSSSATTVMVVGFVNSGIMTLHQSIHVIMGANIGTTVTAWLLSLTGIDSDATLVKFLNPEAFTPILALIGIIWYLFLNNEKKKDTGLILLGFAVLMFGMETMSGSVSGLSDVPEFQKLFILFTNPILGVLTGAILTGIIQSSSASVGILQALATTGQVTYGAAIPIIMGQNIGTCVTALLSSIGTTKNARRAALVHLSFNVIGTIVWLTVFCIIKYALTPTILGESATLVGIAICHSLFNILCTIIMLPLSGMLEKLVYILIPEDKADDTANVTELDVRLLEAPSLALERARRVLIDMVDATSDTVKGGLDAVTKFKPEYSEAVRNLENETDHYEDILGNYLVELSEKKLSESQTSEVAEYLKLIADFERIADHGLNILECGEELHQKGIEFSTTAKNENAILNDALREIMELSFDAFKDSDREKALAVEPLYQVIEERKEEIRTHHVERLQTGECSIEAGFVLADYLTDVERIAGHCANVAGEVLSRTTAGVNTHEATRFYRNENENFREKMANFEKKYNLAG